MEFAESKTSQVEVERVFGKSKVQSIIKLAGERQP